MRRGNDFVWKVHADGLIYLYRTIFTWLLLPPTTVGLWEVCVSLGVRAIAPLVGFVSYE